MVYILFVMNYQDDDDAKKAYSECLKNDPYVIENNVKPENVEDFFELLCDRRT